MPNFDCTLEGWPTLRVAADDADKAKVEYFRLYRLESSHAAFTAVSAASGSVPPVEPDTWVKWRKDKGTFGTEKPLEGDKPTASTPAPEKATVPPEVVPPSVKSEPAPAK